ncbi:hypothetical protein EDB19DRAFT_353727 [Suillus lakei]|nr:hypothetical protein EDB19DRAFT_353727 [Suillus lakei]
MRHSSCQFIIDTVTDSNKRLQFHSRTALTGRRSPHLPTPAVHLGYLLYLFLITQRHTTVDVCHSNVVALVTRCFANDWCDFLDSPSFLKLTSGGTSMGGSPSNVTHKFIVLSYQRLLVSRAYLLRNFRLQAVATGPDSSASLSSPAHHALCSAIPYQLPSMMIGSIIIMISSQSKPLRGLDKLQIFAKVAERFSLVCCVKHESGTSGYLLQV